MKYLYSTLIVSFIVSVICLTSVYGFFDGPGGGFTVRSGDDDGFSVSTNTGISLSQCAPIVQPEDPGGMMLLSIPAPLSLPTNNIPTEYTDLTDWAQIELRTNAVLDEFVADFETNALALYSYVLNHIDCRDLFNTTPKSVRGALGSYLEREGNTLDLCSLTIYLLRRCGIPCAYGFVPMPGVQASDLFDIYGYEVRPATPGYHYYPNTTQTIVYAYVSMDDGMTTNWTALIPWWKNREFIEGIEFRDILTNNYETGYGIVDSYLHRDVSLQQCITNTSDLAMDFLPELLEETLKDNRPDTSLDQLGVQWRLKEQYLDNWPLDYDTYVATDAVITASATLPDHMREKVSMKLVKNGGGIMFSNTYYTVGLHNRRILLSFEPATPTDWTIVANGFYEAGRNFNMVSKLSFSQTSQFLPLTVSGSGAQTVRMGDPVTMYIDTGHRQVLAGNYECYVFNFGRVTDEMLEMHYRELDALSVQTKSSGNLTWANIDAQTLLGEQLCTVGFNYYHLLTKSTEQIESWTKTRLGGNAYVSSFFFRLEEKGGMTYLADSMSIDAFNLLVDNYYYLHAKNSYTDGVYRSEEPNAQERDCFSLTALSMSTLEHGILQRSVGFDDAMSSDKCLRMAVENGGIVSNLTEDTYAQVQNQQMISNVSASAYSDVASFFARKPDGEIWFPDREVTSGTYEGYGWLELDLNVSNKDWSAAYLIRGDNYGGRSESYQPAAYESTSWVQTGNNTVYVSDTTPQQSLLTASYEQDTVYVDYTGQNSTRTVNYISGSSGDTDSQVILDASVGYSVWGVSEDRSVSWNNAASFYDITQNSYGNRYTEQDNAVQRQINESGYYGDNTVGFNNQSIWGTVADPVDTRTGEFYIDDIDLLVPGPKPIEFRRAYSSHYGAVGEFGFGWRFNHASYLAVGSEQFEIRAVEPDGTVIQYTNTGANVWVASKDLNVRLANQNNRGIGSIANPFLNRIEKSETAGQTNYTLISADGATRVYTENTFAEGQLTKTRPWLTQWSDANGNTLTYEYGANSNRVDYGRITKIQNATHYVKMRYNDAGRLREVLCDDGRVLRYEYSPAGDLTTVRRPDGSYVNYEYEERIVPRHHYLEFDEEDESINNYDDNGLLRLTTGLTVEVWINVPQESNDRFWTIVRKGTMFEPDYAIGKHEDGDLMFFFEMDGGSLFYLYPNGGSGHPANIKGKQGWHHIAVTYDLNMAHMYLDGQLVASTNTSVSLRTSSYGLTFNASEIKGLMDDVLIWNYARTETQVRNDMDTPPEGSAPGLVGAWTFNDGSFNDTSGYNHNNRYISGDPTIGTDDRTYSSHLVTREIKPGGRILENVYDDQRRVVEQKATVGLSAEPVQNATFAYVGDGMNGMTFVSNVFGAATTYAYSNGLVVSVTDALGFFESNQWDDARNLITSVDKRGVRTRFIYDLNGNPTNISVIGDITGNGNVSTAVTWHTYTSNNLMASKTEPSGFVTRYQYDQNRNLIQKEYCLSDSDPWNPTNNSVYRTDYYEYDAYGHVTNELIAAGSIDEVRKSFVYNTDGHLTQTRLDPGYGQESITFNYDVNDRGWVTKMTDPTGAYKTFNYDAMGRVEVKTSYNMYGTILDQRSYDYDENGNTLKEDGPRSYLNDAVYRTYDRMNRAVKESHSRYDVEFNGYYPYYSYIGEAEYRSTYDAFGNLVETIDPNGHVTRYAYDSLGQLICSTNYQGAGSSVLASIRQWYDTGGLVLSNQTPRGYVEKATYNAQGQPVQMVYADDAVEQWRYAVSGLLTQHLDPRGVITHYEYNDFGLLTNRIEAVGTAEQRSYSFSYDMRGNQISATDPEGFITSNCYDQADRLILAYGATGPTAQQVISNHYDGMGRVLTVASVGSTVSNAYDGLGRIIRKNVYTSGDLSPVYTEEYAYSHYDFNDVRSTLIGGSEYVDQYLDESGRVGLTLYDDLSAEKQHYDLSGNLDQTIDELSRSTYYAYDGLNRLISKTTPDGITVSHQYDAAGNRTNVLYPNGINHIRTYDPRNRLLDEKVTGNGSDKMFSYDYAYDANGNMTTQTTARGISIINTYDALNRKVRIVAQSENPFIDDIDIALTRTPNGWTESADDQNHFVSRSFDQKGRILYETNQFDSQTLIFNESFDADGRRIACGITPGGESWSFKYNGTGNPTNLHWAGFDFGIGFDSQGRQTSLNGPYLEMTTTWSIRNRIEERAFLHVPSQQYLFYEDAAYRDDNQRTQNEFWYYGFSSFKANRYGYDAMNRLTNEVYYTDSSTWQTNDYTYDASSLRTEYIRSTASGAWQRTATPDNLHRLATESVTLAGSNPVITISGQALYTTNILVRLNGSDIGYAEVDVDAGIWTLSGVQLVSGTNQITAIADPDELWTTNAVSALTLNLYVRGSYVYDADGNLVYVNRDNNNYAYNYDALGRLSAATLRDPNGNGWNWSCDYDPFGRRIKTMYSEVSSNQVTSTKETSVLCDPLNSMQEVLHLTTGSETSTKFYLYGPDLSGKVGGLGGIGGLVFWKLNGYPYQVMSDMRGNVVGDSTSSQVYFYPWYTAFGAMSEEELDVPTYSTRNLDETGLIFLGARYYSPVTGMFLSPDPMRFADSRNLYAYVNHNPVNRMDPDGRLMKIAGGISIAAASTVPLLAPEPVTTALGIAGYVYGADMAASGVRGLLGYDNRTITSHAISETAQAAGASPQQARQIGEFGDMVVGTTLSAGTLNSIKAMQYKPLNLTVKSGPGQFKQVSEVMSERASQYQSDISGHLSEYSYVANGVKYDSFDDLAGKLIDAKGPGYANFVKDGQFQPWFSGADDLVMQAQRQLQAAEGTPIQWFFAEETAADATKYLLQSRGITGVEIIYSP